MNERLSPIFSDLQEVIDYIASRFVFDEASYPLLSKLTPEERVHFSVNHSFQHMAKQIGKIAAHLEDRDHGGAGNPDILKEALVKEFINILRLAELLHIDAEELLSSIPKYMK
jgi:hypothetical protein